MVSRLSDKEVSSHSGPADDLSRSLDAERSWLKVRCGECDTAGVVEEPGDGANTRAEEQDVIATLPDGTEVPVRVPVAIPAESLRWECSECGKVQEVSL